MYRYKLLAKRYIPIIILLIIGILAIYIWVDNYIWIIKQCQIN